MSSKTNLIGLSVDQLKAFFANIGEKPFRAQQVLKWMHHYGISDFSEMTNLSKSLRAQLTEIAEIKDPPIISEQKSKDGTIKWLVRVASGSRVETVFIPEDGRGTLCISSQAGCILDCSFCATGKQGFNSQLMAHEIIGQIRIAKRSLNAFDPAKPRQVTNVVMMGMGEPLLNLDQVMPAIDIMLSDLGYGLSKRRVTVSTAGVVPGIQHLMENTDVSLALSLHAPTDTLRNELVPINKKYPIKEVLNTCDQYIRGLGDKRSLTVEYTLLNGINDQPEQAKQLAKLLKQIPCKINLIPFNPFANSGYERPNDQSIEQFRLILLKAGYTVTVRTTRGDDIQAACGQLAGDIKDKTKRHIRYIKKWQAEDILSESQSS